jgi:hypothetical protein
VRPEGVKGTSKWSARRPTATSLREALRRAVSRTRAPFNEEGILTRMPFFDVLLALKVLAVYTKALQPIRLAQKGWLPEQFDSRSYFAFVLRPRARPRTLFP